MQKAGEQRKDAGAAKTCATCALLDHGAYICARWRRVCAVNELKKKIPVVRRGAVKDMRCPYYWAGTEV